MKKLLAILLVSLLMVAGLSGVSLAEKPYEGKTINVLVWADTMTEAIEKKIPEFEEKTGIDVKFETLASGSLTEKVALNLTGETGKYDLVAIDEPFVPRFAQYLIPYEEWPEGKVYDKTKLDELVSAAVTGSKWEGKVQGIPINANIYMFLYRKDLINDPQHKEKFKEEYGYELQAPDTTDQMLDIAQFFHNPPEMYGWAPFTVKSEGATIECMWALNTFGTQIIDRVDGELKVVVDKEKAVKALEFYKELMETSPPGKQNFGHPETNQNIKTGKIVMALNWPAIIAGYEDEEESRVAGKLGYTVGPKGPDGEHSAITGTWMMGMSKNAENKQAAAEFGYWWTGEKAGRDLIEAGMSPVRKELLSDSELQETHPWYEGQLENFEIGDNRPRYPNYTEVSDKISTYFSKAVSEELTTEEAVDQMVEDIKAVLADE